MPFAVYASCGRVRSAGGKSTLLNNLTDSAIGSLGSGHRRAKPRRHGVRTLARTALVVSGTMAIAACQSVGLSSSVGPTRNAIVSAPTQQPDAGVRIINVTDGVARQLNVPEPQASFAEAIGDALPVGSTVGVGDTLEVTIWEAPPAVLFGAATLDTRVGSPIQGSRPSALPELMVGPSGQISVPFAGQIRAAGRTLQQIERDIVARLQGRAHLPQAIVRIARNVTATVTVVGDVETSTRMPLTPRGERLLDALAQAGGTSHPLDRMTVQITRGSTVRRMAVQDVIRDPRHNVVLQSDDVITALFQPFSFTALGAAGKNEEIRFEGMGITLSQALGRIGGLQDQRADPKGVFVFRWETPATLGTLVGDAIPGPDGRIPVIYRVDMNSPATYFAVQNFRMRDGDVVYVSNSPLADFQRFVNIIASSVLPVASVNNAIR